MKDILKYRAELVAKLNAVDAVLADMSGGGYVGNGMKEEATGKKVPKARRKRRKMSAAARAKIAAAAKARWAKAKAARA